jgi:hypothetical protein
MVEDIWKKVVGDDVALLAKSMGVRESSSRRLGHYDSSNFGEMSDFIVGVVYGDLSRPNSRLCGSI